MSTKMQAARHATTTAGPAESTSHNRPYRHRPEPSILEQAADVLLVLQYPVTVIERVGFNALLARRLREAYGGPEHE